VVDFDVVMKLNVRAAYFMAQAMAKRLIETRLAGSIINMSSQMGHVGGADRSLYCAPKWSMEGFSKSMAIDLARHRIRVNTIAPTLIETPMTKLFFEDVDFRDRVLAEIKLGRLNRLSSCAATCEVASTAVTHQHCQCQITSVAVSTSILAHDRPNPRG
jgi:NAD(P)-dependent dehydrogenase (short-subunit alcohol dehydrogenase family)